MNRFSAVIAHYDPDGNVAQDLFDLSKELSIHANEVFFVSTNISDEWINTLSNFCTVISRDNYGYDFWSYKVGIDSITDKSSIDSIIILNSSVIYFKPKEIISEFLESTPREPCVRGITISNEKLPHVQSYWVQFNSNKLINSEDFNYWWKSMIPISEQKEVIDKYEIGMSQYFSMLGYPLKSLYSPNWQEKVLSACRGIADNYFEIQTASQSDIQSFAIDTELSRNINPTSILWDVLLQKYHMVKVKNFQTSNRDYRPHVIAKYISEISTDCERSKLIKYIESRGILL